MIGLLLPLLATRPDYADKIPNAARVTGCDGSSWVGVGHLRASGGGPRNTFGADFAASNFQWTQALCEKDSDGDGLSNGRELGDPDCLWVPGATPEFTVGITHPGIDCSELSCDGSPDERRLQDTGPTGCAKYQANASGSHEFAFPPHPVAADTSYVKAAFTWPEAASSAVVRFEILNRNPNVVHHMILYRCPRNMADEYGTPSTGTSMGCTDILTAWAVGGGDFCAPEGIAFNIDPAAPYHLIEIHYDNPSRLTGIMDTSGFRMHYVPSAGSGLAPASVIFVGAQLPKITVPAGLPSHRATVTVTSKDLSKLGLGPEGISIFAHTQHSTHITGAQTKRTGFALA